MAKKSNKTEQVLKLITKDEETIGKLAPEVVLKEKPSQELKVEAKLTIEIYPEVELKKKEPLTEAPKTETKPVPAAVDICPEMPEHPAEPELVAEPEPPESKMAAELEMAADRKPGRRRLEQGDPLLNLSEILVKEKAPDVIEKMRVCTCEACHNDVLALALNMLPTKYVTTDEGKQFLQLEMYKKQYETDVLSALTRACVRVKASPRH